MLIIIIIIRGELISDLILRIDQFLRFHRTGARRFQPDMSAEHDQLEPKRTTKGSTWLFENFFILNFRGPSSICDDMRQIRNLFYIQNRIQIQFYFLNYFYDSRSPRSGLSKYTVSMTKLIITLLSDKIRKFC